MYLSHFNLTEKPFQITPDPRFLWLGEKHKEALAVLKYGVLDRKGFLLLTGDVGTGKTTLIRALLNALDNNTIVATIVDPDVEKLEFFDFLAEVFGIHKDFTRKVDFLSRFSRFLHTANSEGKRVLLIIDEAQRLSKELLEEIRLLSNIEKQDAKLLNIFFVGQNEFNSLLTQDDTRALRQRITITYQIKPLTEAETRQYVTFRLKVAGTQKEIFSNKAIREIFKFSKGYPRLINVIADHALLTGYVRDIKTIPPSVVKECAQELTLPGEHRLRDLPLQSAAAYRPRTRLLPKAVFATLSLLLVISAAYLVYPEKSKDVFQTVKNFCKQALGNTGRPHSGSKPDVVSMPQGRSAAPVDRTEPETETLHALPVLSDEYARIKKPINQDEPKQPAETIFTERPGQPLTYAGLQDPDTSGTSEPDLEKTDEAPMLLFDDFCLVIPFNYDTNELPVQAQSDLDRLAATMVDTPDIGIVVTGFTDALGTHQYNVKLSEFRALVIKSYLVAKGISPWRIQTVGMAEKNPMKSNETTAGRSANRRVEITLK